MLPRLSRLIAWQGILSPSEASCAIHAYRTGDDYACEAVAHYGGPQRLIADAVHNRHRIMPILTELDHA